MDIYTCIKTKYTPFPLLRDLPMQEGDVDRIPGDGLSPEGRRVGGRGGRKRARGTSVLTPDVHAPAGLLEPLGHGGDGRRRDGELVDVARGGAPSLQEIFGAVAGTVARLPPIGDEFPRHLERVPVLLLQADLLLAAERAALALVGLAGAGAGRRLVLRIVHRILYTTRTALHDGLPKGRTDGLTRSPAFTGVTAGYISGATLSLAENNQFQPCRGRSPGRSISRPRAVSSPEATPRRGCCWLVRRYRRDP